MNSLQFGMYGLPVNCYQSLKKHVHVNSVKHWAWVTKEWLILLGSRDLEEFQRQRFKLRFPGVGRGTSGIVDKGKQ